MLRTHTIRRACLLLAALLTASGLLVACKATPVDEPGEKPLVGPDAPSATESETGTEAVSETAAVTEGEPPAPPTLQAPTLQILTSEAELTAAIEKAWNEDKKLYSELLKVKPSVFIRGAVAVVNTAPSSGSITYEMTTKEEDDHLTILLEATYPSNGMYTRDLVRVNYVIPFRAEIPAENVKVELVTKGS